MPDARATLSTTAASVPSHRSDALHAAVGIRDRRVVAVGAEVWTRDAARVLGWDGVGTLASSGHADLVVVDRDPLDCALDALSDTRVLRTVVGESVGHDTGAP